MKISITNSNSITAFATVWDDFLPVEHHLRSRHLLAFERSQVPNIQTRYIQVFQKDQLVGLLYIQLFNFKHEHLNFAEPGTFFTRALRLMLPRQLSLLVCGNLFRVDFQGFYFRNPVRPTLVLEALQLFLAENKQLKLCGIIIKDCESLLVEDNFKPFGYRFFNGDVTMELERRKHWNQFDDYLKDLNKNYHQRAKKIIKAFEQVQVRELDAAAIIQNAPEIESLYWNVVNKQTVKLGTVNAAYFYELKKDLGSDFEFYAIHENGRMLGFYTFIFYEKSMETHYIGLDYDANQRLKLYFNILFLSTRKMIEKKYDSLELGRTAREAKVNLGALPKQIYNYIKVNNPLVSMAVHHFLNRFNKQVNPHLVERNPLK